MPRRTPFLFLLLVLACLTMAPQCQQNPPPALEAWFEDVPDEALAAPQGGLASPHVPAGCPVPAPGGPLGSKAVSVGGFEELRVILSTPAPSPGGTVIELTTSDPTIATAGGRNTGFMTQVSVPAGQQVSTPFTLIGEKIGLTHVTGRDLGNNFVVLSLPVVVWDVGNGGGDRLLDAMQPPENHCRDDFLTLFITNDINKLAVCGRPVKGVGADGLSPLLLRLEAGLTGNACFEVLDEFGGAPQDQGAMDEEVVNTQLLGSRNIAPGLYVPPQSWKLENFIGDRSRTVVVRTTFVPTTANPGPSSIDIPIEIVPPPLVAIHGLWGSPESFSPVFEFNNDAQRTTILGDYSVNNHAELVTNVPRVREFVDAALAGHRMKGYAATKVDVVGHSMGAILARMHAADSNNRRPENLGFGDFHRFMIVNAPMFGTPLANSLLHYYAVASTQTETITNVIARRENAIRGGAICDLAHNAPSFNLAQLDVPVAAYTATGGELPPGDGSGALYPTIIEGALFLMPQYVKTLIKQYRFRGLHDGIVGVEAQQAGLPAFAVQNETTRLHTTFPETLLTEEQAGLPQSDFHADQILSTLESPFSFGSFAASLPAVSSFGDGSIRTVPSENPPPGFPGIDESNYDTLCSPVGFLRGGGVVAPSAPPPGGISIDAPLGGSVFAPGDLVDVTVSADPALSIDRVVGHIDYFPDLGTATAAPYTFQVAVPPTSVGDVPLRVDTWPVNSGEIGVSAEITIHVAPPSPPIALRMAPAYFLPSPGTPTLAQTLRVTALYLDGTERRVHGASTGTSYESLDPSVVTVAADGTLTAVADGTASVKASNGSASAFATVVVGDPISQAAPTDDVTASIDIQRGGIRLDRNTGFYVQQVTIANTGNEPVVGPLWLVLSGLPVDVQWTNADTLTTKAAPIGSPAGRLPLLDGYSLAPGQGIGANLRFLNPDAASPIDYQAEVVSGAVP